MATTRITIDPNVMLGKPVIRGTRITVESVLKKLSQNLSPQEVLKEYPKLTEEDISAVLDYAAMTVGNEEIYPVGKQ